MAVNVKVGLIGALDMLKFKNMAKVREKAIQAAPALEVTADYAINNNAKALHPDYQELVIDKVIEHKGAGSKTFLMRSKDGGPVAFFRAGQYLSPVQRRKAAGNQPSRRRQNRPRTPCMKAAANGIPRRLRASGPLP